MNALTSLQAMLGIAKGVDIFVVLFVCIGWSFMEKNEYNYAVVCFAMALVLAVVVVVCKAKYHVDQKKLTDTRESSSNTDEAE